MPSLPNCLGLTGRARRHFLAAAAVSRLSFTPAAAAAEAGPNVLGPTAGYSPETGVLLSEMAWIRSAVLRAVRGMTVEQLDFLLDNQANRIGALLLHLAATERLYQLNTFENGGAQDLDKNSAFKEWRVPARQQIKGNNLDYYLSLLRETRERTLVEFRKRDDKWLLSVDTGFVWGPTNNLCKWFHVWEHESHHAGQISLVASRTPGSKAANG
ncbi:MAG TPA: DinB family protein [Bryobacteraceae bacterium]|nr:DinB family protein [Bryobacteraceae bacterium]